MENKISITRSTVFHKLEVKDNTDNNYVLILDNELEDVYNILGKYIKELRNK